MRLILIFTFFAIVGCEMKIAPVDIPKEKTLVIQKKLAADDIYYNSMYQWVDGNEKRTLVIGATNVKNKKVDFEQINLEMLEILQKEKAPISNFDVIRLIYRISGRPGAYSAYDYNKKLELIEVEIYDH